jgi:hypothetical protein
MNLADVFTVTFIILGFLIVYIAYWLTAASLFPAWVERCAERFGKSPVRSTLLGLVTWGPILAIGSAISNKAPNGGLKMIGVTIMIVSALAALAGSAGLAWRIGAGMKSARDEHEPWRRTLRGGIALGLTFILPFVGTFFMVWVFVAGFGAFILARPRRAKVVAAVDSVAPVHTPPPMPVMAPISHATPIGTAPVAATSEAVVQ